MNRHPMRPVTEDEIETYARDGIVCLRQVFDPEWVAFLREQVAADMAAPSEMHKNVDAKDGTGHFFYDTFVSHHLPGFMRAVTDGPGAEAAGRVMGADKTNLIFDQLLVKEPGTSTETVWHHDLTYWPVAGEQIATLWLALDPVTAE
ncbi:MAG: phytanoyl-CoA dioxygenase family protein, partial [Pseudomonadota bacterium]|nr:phytanoyl-CoA dioxygenase family protein [Pseudomonadota bacterium]